MHASRQPHAYFFLFFPFSAGMSLYYLVALLPLSEFFVPLPFSLCMESASHVFSFWVFFFYLVTTGWIFNIISLLCENSIKSINQSIRIGEKIHRRKKGLFFNKYPRESRHRGAAPLAFMILSAHNIHTTPAPRHPRRSFALKKSSNSQPWLPTNLFSSALTFPVELNRSDGFWRSLVWSGRTKGYLMKSLVNSSPVSYEYPQWVQLRTTRSDIVVCNTHIVVYRHRDSNARHRTVCNRFTRCL